MEQIEDGEALLIVFGVAWGQIDEDIKRSIQPFADKALCEQVTI